jgi:hypothetical protein
MLEEGIIPPFYSDKLRDDHGSRFPTVLSMSILFILKFDQMKSNGIN